VSFRSDDHYITATNGDDSGAATYTATLPVAGLLYKARAWLNLYASYGQGFQTPVGSELAYRADGHTGLNLALEPASSHATELGVKIQVAPSVRAEVAVFQALTRNEIVVDTNIGGRATYQNGGHTRRRGAETSLDYSFAPNWRLQFAYTYVDAAYRDDYLTCLAAPCAVPTSRVAAGNRLPGLPKNNAYANVRWGSAMGWHADISGQYISNVAANDMNSVYAPAYAVFGVGGGYAAERRRVGGSVFLRVNNLANRRYVGSVIVDDGNGRYFEPGPGLNLLLGFTVDVREQ
jgi:iron complex outermembrane receptor protein